MKRAFESFRRNSGMLALILVVTGGTAYAVDGPNPGTNTVGSEDIIGNEVKSDDIGNGRVFNLDLADDAIQSGKIKNGTLTGDDLAPPPEWTSISLNPAYGPYQFPAFYPGPSCYRDHEDVVHLRGVASRVSGANPGATLGTLPAACLPESNVEVLAVRLNGAPVGTGSSPVLMETNGTITVETNIPPVGEHIGLDSITFRGS